MVNSGAIMSVVLLLNLVRPDFVDMATKFEFVHNYIKEMAGEEHVVSGLAYHFKAIEIRKCLPYGENHRCIKSPRPWI